jgi:hypothetical protein
MKHALAGIVTLVVAAGLAASCGVSVGGSGAPGSDGGSQDGTLSCGSSGEPCVAADDAPMTAESDVGVEAGDTAYGSDASDDAFSIAEAARDSSGDGTVADVTSDASSAATGAEGGTTDGGGGDAGGMDASAVGRGDAAEGGARACLVPDGGAPCNPGTVPCGSTTCNTATEYCCEESNGDGTCDPVNGGSCASGIKVACNEAADCASGVCCQEDTYGPHSATCQTSCPTGYFQVCRTDAECGTDGSGAPQTCIVQLCPPSAGAAATVTLEACAYSDLGGPFGPLPFCVVK